LKSRGVTANLSLDSDQFARQNSDGSGKIEADWPCSAIGTIHHEDLGLILSLDCGMRASDSRTPDTTLAAHAGLVNRSELSLSKRNDATACRKQECKMFSLMPRIYTDGKWKLDRVSALSDGVIAIVITLLVLGLEVPSARTEPEQELAGYLLESLPAIAGYVVSFIIILMYWMQHYAIFHFVTRANRPFVFLNGVFLLFLTFLPFPTGLHAAYFDDTLAAMLYGGAQILCGLSLLLLWVYATIGRRLVSKDIPGEVVASMTRRLALTPLLCLSAIVAAYIDPWLSRLIFLLIPCSYISQRAVDEGWLKMQSRDAVANDSAATAGAQ
jgi:uncharacterized membrane protein